MQGKIMLDKPTTFKEKLESQGAGKAEAERKLNARDVREWLSAIPSEHLIFMGMDKKNRPEWVVLKVLPVPPITVRPSITLDSGDRSEDDLTHKLVDVLRINQRLRENRDTGAPQLIVEDLWELVAVPHYNVLRQPNFWYPTCSSPLRSYAQNFDPTPEG